VSITGDVPPRLWQSLVWSSSEHLNGQIVFLVELKGREAWSEDCCLFLAAIYQSSPEPIGQ